MKKYNDAEEERRVDLISDGGDDVTDMIYLKHLNGFLFADGFIDIWLFPTNQSQQEKALLIRNREQDLRRNAGER